MSRKKNPNNNYFNQDVEDAVCAYLHTDNPLEKEKHFRIIYPALCKIAEVWYHKVKFSYSDDDMEDVMASCVAWLVEKMPMFKCGQGTKAFSYYTVTARFYYIQLANKNYKYFKNNIPLSSLTNNWDIENSDREDERISEYARLFHRFIEYCYHNSDSMFSPLIKKYANLVLDTLSKYEDIEDLRNRKVLQLIYRIGKVTEYEKKHIGKAINIMSSHLTLFKERFLNGDDSIELCVKDYLTAEEIKIVKDTVVVGKKNNGTQKLAKKFGVDVKVVTNYLRD